MRWTHILRNIPKTVQERYNLASDAKAEVTYEVYGGHLRIQTKDGGAVEVDAVELSDTGITIEII